jgi:hypothetical protein
MRESRSVGARGTDARALAPDDTRVMSNGNVTSILVSLAFASAMLLAGVKKRAIRWTAPRTCVVCKQPLRRCRCH